MFAHLLGNILRNINNHGIDYTFDIFQPLLQDLFFLTCWDDRRADEGWGGSRWRLTRPQQLLLKQQLHRRVKKWNTTHITMILKFHITIEVSLKWCHATLFTNLLCYSHGLFLNICMYAGGKCISASQILEEFL